jgi:hypothetical protein
MPLEDPEAFFRQIRKSMLPSPVRLPTDSLSQRESGGKSLEVRGTLPRGRGEGNLSKPEHPPKGKRGGEIS